MGPKSSSSSSSKSKGGGNAKGKGAAPEEPPKKTLIVPEPGQKLTREQHAHNRAVRAEAAAAEKRALFGSWTGKTPATVLNEQCAKLGWGKAEISTSKKAKGYQGSVQLSKEDPKTKARRRVVFCDTLMFCDDDQNAKHFAATFALHRFCSHLSLHRLLPPAHQQYWAELEVRRKASPPDVQLYEYAADPFAVDEARAKAEREREKEERELRDKKERAQMKAERPWERFPAVKMSTEARSTVEELIKGLTVKSLSTSIGSDDPEVVDALVKKGFRRAHATEAVQYCSDLVSAMDWLCLHVPEDDLPAAFHTKTTEIATGQSTVEGLAREWAIKRVLPSGFSPQLLGEAYDANGQSILRALSKLVTTLSGVDTSEPTADDADTSLWPAWLEEVEAISSMYDKDTFRIEADLDGASAAKDSKGKSHKSEPTVISIRVRESAPCLRLVVGIPKKPNVTYPNTLPALFIDCPELPAYMRLGILKALAQEASSTLLGGPMIIAMVMWLEEHLDYLIEKPAPLMSLSAAVHGGVVRGSGPGSNSVESNKSRKRSGQRKERQSLDSERLRQIGEAAKAKHEKLLSDPDYQRMFRARQRLPSFKFRETIIKSVATNSVVIICGETGCGKSTQTGQFLLESIMESGQAGSCSIICTQPRRISALSLAERVAQERAETVGETVGFAIRGDTVRSSDTRLLFCTTGILLRMLAGDPSLSKVSHVIVDEVHERSVDSDFLLVILRELVAQRPDFRLILMSATIDSETFAGYFSGAPVITIPGFTHPVTDLYLEDIVRLTHYEPAEYRAAAVSSRKSPASSSEESNASSPAGAGDGQDMEINVADLSAKARSLFREGPDYPVEYSLIAAVVRSICGGENGHDDDGAVLVFLQGAMEIKRCIDVIRAEVGSDYALDLLPLHANLPPRDQAAVFRRPKKGVRKVVVATNVAETSITIDDVVYVIDAGRVKEMHYENGTLCLKDTLASRASCKQRRGRAGRVRPGFCYKLFSRRLEAKMAPHSVPELLRVPLEQLCLSLKAMGVTDVHGFLAKAIDPPPAMNVQIAVEVLRSLGAVSESDELTSLGKHMASIPADLRIAKMLIYGAIFHCLGPILTIAAIMSSKSPFAIPYERREEGRKARASFLWESSDWLTEANAFDAWVEASKRGKARERDFCEANFMSSNALVAISDLRKQYLDNLRDIGFVPDQRAFEGVNAYSKNPRVIKAVIVAGLYPQIATIQFPDITYVETAHGTMVKEVPFRDVTLFTAEDGQVHLHPTSVLHDAAKVDQLLLAYHQKVATSKVFVRDGTLVSAWPVLMFGGSLRVDHEGKTVEVGGFAKFQAFPRIAVLVDGLRRLLDAELGRKVEDPGLDIATSAVGAVLLKLIVSDGQQ
ncbi:P-loop containing nucleoside triphosphate hydrolase protein [Zopfochytrium polystomum]|nr:P-loop containing nucleoside triphosphate hydrolase protein [Zopfochytrium polystomum]